MVSRISAIVFRVVPYQESSLIVTIFSKEFGKIAIIAKGARKPKSRFAGLFDIGALLDIVIYHKSSRSVQTLSEASYLNRNFSLRTDMNKMISVQRIIELSAQMLEDEQVNIDLWDFLANMLNWLESQEECPPNLFPYIQIRLAELQGIGVSLLEIEDNPLQNDLIKGLDIESGMLTDRTHASRFYPLSSNALHFLVIGIQSSSSKLFQMPMDEGERKQLIDTLDQYLSYHIDSVRARRTDQIYRDFL